MREKEDLTELLEYIDPSGLDYSDWVGVGMALKDEGYPCSAWDAWSARDGARYHVGECAKKWDGFRGSSSPVTAGTIVMLAQQNGWSPRDSGGHELEWDSVIGGGDQPIVRAEWVEGKEITEPDTWDPVDQIVRYLEALFEASETVGYVTECWQKDDRYLPTKGAYDRTAGELIQLLKQCGGDIGAVIGDVNPEAGAWIRFNPLDGRGVKNENVTDYRYALVESDTLELEKQNAIITELELPVAALVYSGGKSIHAIVKVEAASYEEYRKRVDYLYDVCKRNGLKLDSQNRNPSRLSRMPGVERKGKKQFLIATNIGKESWQEWHDWVESVNDDLPDPESMADVWDDLPELAPPLIEGVLRQGHKMLVAGPSKAGKSYLLIELCAAIAEGRRWLDWPCAKGRVLYVNLELDRASCLHRFRDVYTALHWEPKNVGSIDIWNLRGKSAPMDKLSPKLIRRAAKKDYIAIVIDPIYKVITGDENSADQMAHFCNQFDLVCNELGCAVIYCHHHSKGAQGGKRSMDRASGSGVFARDPDALLDMIELPIGNDLKKQLENRAICAACAAFLDRYYGDWDDEVGQDEALVSGPFQAACGRLCPEEFHKLQPMIDKALEEASLRTAWRVDGTLREFQRFKPRDYWFDYPIHHADTDGVLQDVMAEDDAPAWKKAVNAHKKSASGKAKNAQHEFDLAVEGANAGAPPTIQDVMDWFNGEKSIKTIRRYVNKYGYFVDKNTGRIHKAEDLNE